MTLSQDNDIITTPGLDLLVALDYNNSKRI